MVVCGVCASDLQFLKSESAPERLQERQDLSLSNMRERGGGLGL